MILKQEPLLPKDINVQLKKIELKLHTGAVDYHVMQNSLDSNQAFQDSGDRPYVDLETTDKYIVREFSQNIDPIELMWHRDNEDRHVEVVKCGKGWKYQEEDKLPLDIKPNLTIFIPRHQWHRVHKGEDTLTLKIWREIQLWEE